MRERYRITWLHWNVLVMMQHYVMSLIAAAATTPRWALSDSITTAHTTDFEMACLDSPSIGPCDWLKILTMAFQQLWTLLPVWQIYEIQRLVPLIAGVLVAFVNHDVDKHGLGNIWAGTKGFQCSIHSRRLVHQALKLYCVWLLDWLEFK